MKFKTGTIVHFNAVKGFGYIQPDEPHTSGKDIHFVVGGSRKFEEEHPGYLDFSTDAYAGITPTKNMRVVYSSVDRPRGPHAFEWNTLEEYLRVKAEIDKRIADDKPLTRMMRPGNKENGYKPKKLWCGRDLDTYLATEHPDLTDESIYFEWKNCLGEWRTRWHPKNWHPLYKVAQAA